MARRIRRVVIAIVALTFLGTAIVFGPDLWHRYGDRLFSKNLCTATVEGETSSLTAMQTDNAALIVAIGMRKGLPEQAMTVALAAALQESDLRNLRVGDQDSLGLFQQRPSKGWGTPEQVLDPHHAANAFYDALTLVDGWESMSVTEAAQAVQRSGFPEAYADHEATAELWAAALSGHAGIDAVSCSLESIKPTLNPEAPLRERVTDDFGSIVSTDTAPPTDGRIAITLASDPSIRDALAAWAVAVAVNYPVEGVTSCGTDWIRERGEWERGAFSFGPSECLPGEVTIILAIS